MARWKVLGVAALTALSFSTPAAAGEGVLGSVEVGSEEITGKCTYSGQTALDGSVSFTFGGTAVARSTTEHQPESVEVTCTLVSPAQGLPGEQPELRSAVGCNSGPACVIPVGVAGNWPVRPVLICITGHAVFSPNGSIVKEIQPACSSAAI